MVLGIGILLLSVSMAFAHDAVTHMLPAFPGAEGFGAISKGGRGGKVIKVTNLDPSGPGSLQEACKQKGPRIVVFDVSGVIRRPAGKGHGYVLRIPHGEITIAGQTAPGAGITVEGGFACAGRKDARIKDIIMRFLRFRPEKGNIPAGGDTAHYCNADRVILDHASIAWSSDECCGFTWTSDFTVQWCAIEESDLITFEGRNLHNFGMLLGYMPAKISLHHNLWAHHSQRMPAATNLKPPGLIDFRNNVCYNGRMYIVGVPRGNVIGNSLVDGPGSETGCTTQKPTWRRGLTGISPRGRNFVDGNFIAWRGGYTAWRPDGFPLSRLKDPIPAAPVTTHTAERGYELVLGHAGCIPRDPLGKRTVHEVRTRTGKWGRDDPAGGLMGGLTPAKAKSDADGDGMPDAWETAHNLNPKDPADANKTVPAGASKSDRHKGYTYIEYYINACADTLIANALAHPEIEQKYDSSLPTPPPPEPAALKPEPGEMEKLIAVIKVGGKQSWRSAMRLKKLGPAAAAAIPALVEGLAADDVRGPTYAQAALAKIGTAAVPALLATLKHEKAKARALAADALGQIKPAPREAIGPLLEMINTDTDHSAFGAVQRAIISLYRMRPLDKKYLPVLIKTLDNPNQFARGFAASNLSELGPAAAPGIPGITKLLTDEGVNTRWAAAWALGEVADNSEKVVNALVKTFEDRDTRPRTFGIISLAKLCKDAPLQLIAALKSENATVRWCAADALGRIGPGAKNAVPALVKQLQDPEARVRKMTALALGRILSAASGNPADTTVIDALSNALSDSDWHVRWAAAKGLGELGAEARDVLDALGKADKDVRREVVESAAEAIQRIKGDVDQKKDKGSDHDHRKQVLQPGHRSRKDR